MYIYLEVRVNGVSKATAKMTLVKWKDIFIHENRFRKIFLLVFYVTLILFRMLINRDLWMNPLCDVMGGWTLTTKNGTFTMDPIENLILFIPFIILLLVVAKDKVLKSNTGFKNILWQSTKIMFLFSLTIEFLQLFLRLGTFQLSDIFYNTVGETIGGMIYWIWYNVKGYKGKRPIVGA